MPDPDRAERFTALYDRYHARVYAYVVSRAGRELADEVTSETFVVAWRRFGDVPAAELGWLLGVARNILREQYRARIRRQEVDAELRTMAAGTHGGDVAEHVAERERVLAALTTLPGGDREILILVAWHGLAPKEAARVIGCSTATYHVRLHRARKRLKRALSTRAPAARNPTPVLATGEECPR